jgi:hypothetical protein
VPTSNETRVRVDAFSNTSAIDLPASDGASRSRLRCAARSNSVCQRAVAMSARVKK